MNCTGARVVVLLGVMTNLNASCPSRLSQAPQPGSRNCQAESVGSSAIDAITLFFLAVGCPHLVALGEFPTRPSTSALVPAVILPPRQRGSFLGGSESSCCLLFLSPRCFCFLLTLCSGGVRFGWQHRSLSMRLARFALARGVGSRGALVRSSALSSSR
jgi:hypothetical protein